jgi:hypothetical protein
MLKELSLLLFLYCKVKNEFLSLRIRIIFNLFVQVSKASHTESSLKFEQVLCQLAEWQG